MTNGQITRQEYIAARERLIPQAEQVACTVAGDKPTGFAVEAWSITWNKAFHGTMDVLARQAGLIR